MSKKTNGTLDSQADAAAEIESQTNGVAPKSNGAVNGSSGFATLATDEDFLSVTGQLKGRRILLTGTTGFLGKAVLSMLLRFHPDVEHIYLVIRGRSSASSQERFEQYIAQSGAFDPLQQIYGAGFQELLDEKITIIDGDLTSPNLGLDEEEARELSENLDLFINSAGLTNFNPNLRNALEINTLSNLNTLDFIRLGGCNAKLLHVSTCFVCGNQSDKIAEVFPGPDIYPRVDEIEVPYDHRREIDDCLKLIEHFEEISSDQEHRVRFVQEAREFMRKNNLNPDDEKSFEKACEKARLNWVKKKLSSEGQERAAFWGWPNIYTYTKSLGERLLAEAADEIDLTIVRPSVIESAEAYPAKSWNEGVNTTAPICYMIYKGHRFIPTREGVNLDIIPVDHVAGAMLGISAALLAGEQHDVYHLGSSDLNPISVARLVELSTLASRRLIDREVKTPAWQKLILKSMDSVPVSHKEFEQRSAPGINRAVSGFNKLLGRLPTKSMGGVGQAINGVRKNLRGLEKITHATEKIFDLFLPFIHHNNPVFVTRNIKKVAARLHPGERDLYGCPIEKVDWREYWIDVHLPGLAKYAFPTLEDKLNASTRESYTYEDLVELFDATTHNYARRVAMQHHNHGIVERYTYAEIRQHAERAADTLSGLGMGRGRTALIVSENRPQWGMTYFGILKTGGIAVPVDSESTADQLLNVARSAHARLIIVSEKVHERLGEALAEGLREQGLPAQVLILNQLFTLALPDETAIEVSVEPDANKESEESPTTSQDIVTELIQADDEGEPLASLIFTSGTTGEPKGVMLSHQNFTHLLGSLQQTFHINERDGFLSVLPLHHTFEFACGLLMPLSRGSSITYMEELSGEELTHALNTTRITALIGVPALWQLLHRRIEQQLDDAPPSTRAIFNALTGLNTTIRDSTGINLGRTLFGAVHSAFGGRLKFMISGGAALPEKTLEAFHGMGFDLYEGYGLTEAAPVLTVNSPDTGLTPGTVGRALPGIEIDIKDPDDQGVGEVIARGPNVMRGYLGREEETEKALQDQWLHTGDLGTIDGKGNLTIVGREKEVIVTASGKNCYPDELEDIYGKAPDVAEISIVGLPDGNGSERVACLIRPDFDDEGSTKDVAETRSAIREWVRVQGSRVASHHRIQVLRFWDQEFPRTATRKIKRREVVKILQRLMDAEMEAVDRGEVEDTTWAWIDSALGTLADYDPARIHNNTHLLDDLAFDSLMFMELASILEARNYHITPEVLAQVPTVGDLQDLLDSDKDASTALIKAPPSTIQRVESYDIPKPVASAVKNLLYSGQMSAYDSLFDVDVFGRANIPHHNPNIIVVANHSSHLDMGLVKYALGDYGTQIRALAAADYFFKNKARKTYFGNFTNLIPVERSGTLKASLGHASEALRRGEMLLVFPEGTRSKTGKIQDFRRGLGYLVDTHNVDVLPLWIDGTYRALPKGQPLPSPTSRKLKVHIGQILRASDLKKEAADLSPTERYKAISASAHGAVTGLRDAVLGGGKAPQQDTLTPIFDELTNRFAENQVDSPLSFYFSLGNWDTHKWTIVVNPENCNIQNGKPTGRADCVIKTSPEIFRKIVQESYVPSMDEFMSGVIKTNDPNLLMRFQSVFGL